MVAKTLAPFVLEQPDWHRYPLLYTMVAALAHNRCYNKISPDIIDGLNID